MIDKKHKWNINYVAFFFDGFNWCSSSLSFDTSSNFRFFFTKCEISFTVVELLASVEKAELTGPVFGFVTADNICLSAWKKYISL